MIDVITHMLTQLNNQSINGCRLRKGLVHTLKNIRKKSQHKIKKISFVRSSYFSFVIDKSK